MCINLYKCDSSTILECTKKQFALQSRTKLNTEKGYDRIWSLTTCQRWHLSKTKPIGGLQIIPYPLYISLLHSTIANWSVLPIKYILEIQRYWMLPQPQDQIVYHWQANIQMIKCCSSFQDSRTPNTFLLRLGHNFSYHQQHFLSGKKGN